MTRLGFAALMVALLGATVGGVAALAWSLRSEVAYRTEPAHSESSAELIRAATRGCVEALGLAEVGVSEAGALIRCRPGLGIEAVEGRGN